jgi:uncharacterized coiled-coil protein SlyX
VEAARAALEAQQDKLNAAIAEHADSSARSESEIATVRRRLQEAQVSSAAPRSHDTDTEAHHAHLQAVLTQRSAEVEALATRLDVERERMAERETQLELQAVQVSAAQVSHPSVVFGDQCNSSC